MKKLYSIPCLLLCAALAAALTGCSLFDGDGPVERPVESSPLPTGPSAEEAAEEVLTRWLTAPDPALEEAILAMDDKEIHNAVANLLGENVPDDLTDTMIQNQLYPQYEAVVSGFTSVPDTITLTESATEGVYDFEAEVTFAQGDTAQTITLSGQVVTEEGVVTALILRSNQEFAEFVQGLQQPGI